MGRDPIGQREAASGSDRRLLAAAGLFLFGLLITVGVVAGSVLLRSFARLEEEDAQNDALQVAGALMADLASLENTTADWAFWDDARQFVQQPTPAFEAANLNLESLDNLRINTLVFLDNSGRIVCARSFDLETRTPAPLRAEALKPDRFALPPSAGQRDGCSGLLLTPDHIMLVAARPILNSKRQGPAAGTLLMARWLTATELERLSAITHLRIVLWRLDDGKCPNEVRSLASDLCNGNRVAACLLDGDTVKGYAILNDFAGDPAVLVETRAPRLIHHAGTHAVRYLVAGVVTVGLLFGLAGLLLVRCLAASQRAVRRRAEFEELIARVAARFLRLAPQKMDDAIRDSLGEIAAFAGASHCCLFQLSQDGATAACTHAWGCNSAESTAVACGSLRRDDFPWAAARLEQGESVAVTSLSQLPAAAAGEKAALEARGLRSLLVVPLVTRDGPRGFLGLATAAGERAWAEEDHLLLQMAGVVFAKAMEQRRADEELIEANQRLEKALDELRATQEQIVQQERLSALGQMASGIAHDFNNALLPILGYTDLLLTVPETLGDPLETREMLQTVCNAARDAARVVRRLSDFYRRRDAAERLEAVDLGKTIQDAARLSQPRWKDQALAEGRNIALSIRTHGEPWVLGDPSELRQMLLNLILNAADAMPDGGTISIQARRDDDAVLIEVRDTGVGMTDEAKRRCFDPFYTTKEGRGSGLGLAMVYGIVHRHGGTIRVESAPGEGSAFLIHLPALRGGTSPTAPTSPGEGHPRSKPLHVLVVDDDVVVRRVLQSFLETDGHQMVGAANAEEALEKLRGAAFDLVILDRAMPGMSGTELAAVIKRDSPGQRIIMLSGFGDTMATSGEAIPCVDLLLTKPICHEELAAAIRSCLAGAPGRLTG